MATKLSPTIQYRSTTYVLLNASIGYSCASESHINDNYVKLYYPLDRLSILLVETTDDDPAAQRTYRFKPAFRNCKWSYGWVPLDNVTIYVNTIYGDSRARKLLSEWETSFQDMGDKSYSANIRNIEFTPTVLKHPAMHGHFDTAIAAHKTKLLHELSDKLSGLVRMKDDLDRRGKKNAEPFR